MNLFCIIVQQKKQQIIIKGAQAKVFKLSHRTSGELFAGKFYFSSDPELIQQAF